MPFKGTPAEKHMPAGWGKKILHASLVVDNGNVLMGSDAGGDQYEAMKGISVALVFKDAKEGARIFKALSAKGKVGMPFQETFWSSGFGMLVDQFGTPWMINSDKAG